jgi:UDP-N-acetylglucosamine transferase subunit ALG13
MVLVTTGTNEQPFDRLVRAAAALPDSVELLVQHGSSRVRHGRQGRWVDFLSFDELHAAMEAADVVVSHAGVGSILLAQRCGKRPIVVPRRFSLGEAVDDHQLPFARRLAELGALTLVEAEERLAAAIAAQLDMPPPAPVRAVTAPGVPGEGLAAEVRQFLAGCTPVLWS